MTPIAAGGPRCAYGTVALVVGEQAGTMVAESPPWQRRWYRHPKITQLHVGGAECRLQAMCKADHNWGLRWQRRGSLARSTAATRACHRGNRLSLDKISSPSAAAGRSAVPRCPRRRRRMACTAHIERGPCEKWHGPCTKTGDADPGASQRHDALLGFRGLRLHHGPRSAPP